MAYTHTHGFCSCILDGLLYLFACQHRVAIVGMIIFSYDRGRQQLLVSSCGDKRAHADPHNIYTQRIAKSLSG